MVKLGIMQFCDHELWFDSSSCMILSGVLTTYTVFCNKKKESCYSGR